MRRGLAAAAVGAVVALSFAPLFAPAAQAQSAVTITASPITLSPAPGPAGNVFTNMLSVSGHFHVDGGFQPTFDWASANLSWRGKAPGPPVPGPYTICGNPPAGPPGAACSGQDVDYKDQKLLPAPTYNGPYRVNATAHASDKFPGGGSDEKPTNNIDFNILAPPEKNVTTVVAAVDSKTRVVTVSWDRDATTPDLFTYFVWRKGPGDKDFTARFQVLQQSAGARLTGTDPESPNLKGGDYLYQVEARRNGASGDNSTYVPSDRTAKESQSNKITVPNPPPGATTVPPKPSPNGAPPVVTGKPSGVNRNSGFSGSGSSSATTPTSEAVTPDPGFVRGLPFAGSNANEQNGEGDNSAVAVTPGRSSSNGKGWLKPVAGAAVLVLGALHLRIFKKRLDEPPSNLTPVT